MKGNILKGRHPIRVPEPPSAPGQGYNTPDRRGGGGAGGGGGGGGGGAVDWTPQDHRSPAARLTHTRTEGMVSYHGNEAYRDGRVVVGDGASIHRNGLHLAMHTPTPSDRSRPPGGAGGGGGGGVPAVADREQLAHQIHGYYDRTTMLRGVRHHSSPLLQHIDETFRGGYHEQQQQQQQRHPPQQQNQPHTTVTPQPPHHQHHRQHQSQARHHPPDIKGGAPIGSHGAGWGASVPAPGASTSNAHQQQRGGGGGASSRLNPRDPSGARIPVPSRASSAPRSGSSVGADAEELIEFPQLPSSPEHMGLKAHAAEFVPGAGSRGGDGGGGARKGEAGAGATTTTSATTKPSAGGGQPSSKPYKGGSKQSSKSTNAASKFHANSDLMASAQEFVPGSGRGGSDSTVDEPNVNGHNGDDGYAGSGITTGASAGEEATTAVVPKMVQVVRGGTIYYVPESEALATDDELVGPEAYEVEEEDDGGFLWAHESSALPAPHRRTMHSTAIPEHLWAEFQNQSLSVLRQLAPDDERLKEIPPQFYAAFPLDSASKTKGTAGSFGYPSETYKVIQHHNGQAYALRRFDTARTTPKIVALATEIWLTIPDHPAITCLREAFVHRNALFFVCDFHPGAETLAQRFIGRPGGLLSEVLIWRIVCQLLTALRAAHAAGAALRNIHPSRVIYSRVGDRVRVNWTGCLDVLEFEGHKPVSELQQQDMRDLGTLVLAMGCRTPVTASTQAESIAFLAQHYSPELHNMVVSLVTKPPNVYDVCVATAHHTTGTMEHMLMANDALQDHLSSEFDNGRLLRLLLKLGTLNERPDHTGGEWAETGERYILKLFRDYCFHQVNGDDEPVLDFGHIYQSLARLDAGDEEKILLTSRDKRSLLVVSFADIKRCLDGAFAEVFGEAAPSPGGSAGGGLDGGDGVARSGSGEGSGSSGGTGSIAGSAADGPSVALTGGRAIPSGVAPIHGSIGVIRGMRGDAGAMGVVAHSHAPHHAHPHGHPPPHVQAHCHPHPHSHAHGHPHAQVHSQVHPHPHAHGHGIPMAHSAHHPHRMAMAMGMVGHPGPPTGPPH